MNCNCKNNSSEVLRIVRGNAFTINIAIEAVRLDGSVVENFDLGESEAILTVIHAGKKTEKEFIVDENNAIIAFDGTDGSGWYGLEMNGVYDAKPWRWCVENVFQLVETNEKANIPSWTFVIDSTYFVTGVMTLMSGDRAQADWAETNPVSASYIRNKPIIYTQAEVNALIQAEAQARQQADQTLQGNITAEATARQQADQALLGNITAEATARQQADATLQANIDAEETRATEAEQANATAIRAERTRATAVEGSLQENVNTEEAARVSADQTLQNSIDTEAARAAAAEQTLQGNIDTEEAARIAADEVLDGKITDSTAAVAAEEARAMAAEQANATAISNEVTRATTAEGTLQDNIDAEETARIDADNALDTKIGANTSAIASEVTRATAAEGANATAISNEVTRATAAEDTLQDNIDDEEAARITADDTLQDNIGAEEAARIAADQVLDGKITDSTAAVAAEEARAMAAEQANATAIGNEVTRAIAAEDTLQDNIDAEETARNAADNALDTKISTNTSAIAAEVTRATAAEQANATAISNEVARATAAEGTLQDNIDDEAAARITADDTLQDNIDAEEAARIAADQVLDGKITDSTEAVAAEETRAKAAEQANATAISNEVTRATTAEGTLQDNIDAEETARISADNALDTKIGTNTSAIAAEVTRATAAEQANATAISNEVTRATTVEGDLQDNIDAEETRAKAAEQANAIAISNEVTRATAAEQANATAISNEVTRATAAEGANATAISNEVTRATAAEGANATAISNEVTRATAAEGDLQDNIDAEEAARISGDQTLQGNIDALSNNTYTKAQVDALTADFITASVNNLLNYYLKSETYTQSEVDALIASVQQFQYKVVDVLPTASAATMNIIFLVPSPTAPNSKDSFVTIDNGAGADPRYTWEQIGSTDIDLSGYYTSQQTDDAIAAALNTALANYTTTANLNTLLAGKQNVISDLATIRSGAAAGATAYQKPSTGIPKTDLASAVQTSLGKADTAYQKPSAGIPSTDMTSAVQTSLGKADTAYQKPSTGIPETDLDASTQQKINTSVDITGKADKVSNATAGDFAGLDSSGNLTDSGKKASDFATAAQGALAATAYQKPSTGIPSTDMSAAVQASLGKADTALQEHQSLANYYTKSEVDDELDGKQDVISDLATIRSGAAAGATAYQKPATGIPSTDMSAAVQASLGKADTALQEHQSLANYYTKSEVDDELDGKQDVISDLATIRIGAAAGATAYQKPATGIPSTDMSAAVQTSLGKADTALQEHQSLANYYTKSEVDDELDGKQDVINDLETIRSGAAAGATAYQKPATGIPETDLDAATQQKINTSVDITGKADKVSGATAGDFAGLDANGNLTDSGKKASDFATAAQGALADTAYQKPSTGIPKTDMASAVQTSLGKADTAYQKPSTGIPKTDMASAVQTSLGKADTAYQKPSTGIPKTDMASAVQTSLGKADTAYQKPSNGIPSTDMTSAVQASLGLANTALQSQVNADWNATSGAARILNKPTIPDVSGLADKVMVVSASPQPSTYQPNTVYQLGTLTGSVTINPFAAIVSGDTEAKVWCLTFSTGSTAPTITWPAAITAWNGGVAPAISASKSYELSVMDGIGVIIES